MHGVVSDRPSKEGHRRKVNVAGGELGCSSFSGASSWLGPCDRLTHGVTGAITANAIDNPGISLDSPVMAMPRRP